MLDLAYAVYRIDSKRSQYKEISELGKYVGKVLLVQVIMEGL